MVMALYCTATVKVAAHYYVVDVVQVHAPTSYIGGAQEIWFQEHVECNTGQKRRLFYKVVFLIARNNVVS